MEEVKKKTNNEKKVIDEKNEKTSKSKNNVSSLKKESSTKKEKTTIKKDNSKKNLEKKSINEKEDKIKKVDVEEMPKEKSKFDEINEEKITIDLSSLKKKNSMADIIAYIVSFLLFNIRWIQYRYEFFGYKSSQNITILQNDMFDLSFLLGIAKVFGIICVIIFFIILIDSFIDLESQFKSLKKYNLKTNLSLIYYGSYIVCLIFTLFGVLFTKNVHFTIGYIISVLVIIICINIVFNKKIEVIKEDE